MYILKIYEGEFIENNDGKNNDIKYYNSSNNINDTFDGGKGQIADYEREAKERVAKEEAKKESYEKFLLEKLKDTPVISLVSDQAMEKIKEFASEYSDFAINVARITEKEIQKEGDLTEEKINNIFEKIIKELHDKGDFGNIVHYNWSTVKILYDTWTYGEIVRRGWNSKFLSGKELKHFNGIYDYRINIQNNSYRVRKKPEFPGKSSSFKPEDRGDI